MINFWIYGWVVLGCMCVRAPLRQENDQAFELRNGNIRRNRNKKRQQNSGYHKRNL